MRLNIKLKISLVVTSVLLIVVGLSSCGDRPANNAAKTNGNTNVGSTNSARETNSAITPKEECDQIKDAAIIDAMKKGVMANQALYDRKRHFNFHVYGCKVKLVGYMDTINYFKDLYALAQTNTTVESIDISGLWLAQADAGTGPVNDVCPGNGVPCGDICLPQGQTCHTKDIQLAPLGSPSQKATPKP